MKTIRFRLSYIWLACLGALPFIACGSDDSSGDDGGSSSCPSQDCPFDYSTVDLSSPAVSFQGEVMPIFQRACNFSSCHGKEVGSKAELYLGPNTSGGDPDAATRTAIIQGIVGQPSLTASSMNLVTASDPANSFLMVKMDGCQNARGLTCDPQATDTEPCGDSMPQRADLLCPDERDTVRRWIAQGAADN